MSKRKKDPDEMKKVEQIPKWLKYLKYLGITVAILVTGALFGYLYDFTGRPTTCSYCHELRPSVESHKRTLHAEINCYECHAERGLVYKVGARFGLIKDLTAHLIKKYERPLNFDGELSKKIRDENCEKCHSPKREYTPRRGIFINHEKHKKKGIECTRCHNRVAHPVKIMAEVIKAGQIATTVTYEDRMQMDYCMKCHVGGRGRPTNACDACHPKEFAQPYNCFVCHEEDVRPPSHLAPGYVETIHKELARAKPQHCYKCHKKESCDDCHKAKNLIVTLPPVEKITFHMPKSHYDPNFVPPVHGDEAKERGNDHCYTCHTEMFCTRCHGGLVMPHPQGFAEEHGKIAKGDGFERRCQQCHQVREEFCEKGCHHRGWDPSLGPLARTHSQIVAINGIKHCMNCHTIGYCAVCHVTGEKRNAIMR